MKDSPRLYAALGSLRDVYKERASLLAQDIARAEGDEPGMRTEDQEGDEATKMALEAESTPSSMLTFNLEASIPVSKA